MTFKSVYDEHNVILQKKHVCIPENMVIYREHMVSMETWAWRGHGRWEELCQCYVSRISELLQGTFRGCQRGMWVPPWHLSVEGGH